MSGLSPTPRTTVRRQRDRVLSDRTAVLELLDEALICHLGVVIDGGPLVLPTVFGVDADGPDQDGTLYLHGSVAARSLRAGLKSDVCVTVTALDGLVLARSAFHHSMNYRSAVIMGRARRVDDGDELVRALRLIIDHVVPGRAATLRPHLPKELAATVVLALPLHEASMKQRVGDPVDDADDVAAGVWAGVVPLRVSTGGIQTAADSRRVGVPAQVVRRVAALTRTDDVGA